VHAIEQGAAIAVASRYMKGGSVGNWVRGRRWLSNAATFLAQKLPNVEVSDPMSGCFAIRTDAYRSIEKKLRPEGFKILFEVLAALPRGTKATDVPMVFQPRLHGESKLSVAVEVLFLKQIVRIGFLRIGITGARFFSLCCAIIFILLLLQAWPLRLLYLDAMVRGNVQRTLDTVADANGWFVSDLEVQRVASDRMRFLHHEHRRGTDPLDCYDIRFDHPVLAPCAD
jgi:hypothetical protein